VGRGGARRRGAQAGPGGDGGGADRARTRPDRFLQGPEVGGAARGAAAAVGCDEGAQARAARAVLAGTREVGQLMEIPSLTRDEAAARAALLTVERIVCNLHYIRLLYLRKKILRLPL